ncbi:MAG: hypothetical protein GWN99_17185 [Gemmatimonadetes bacterium]|uniref:Caspase domain-containing protein n=1 Tax=Candidatus Kutchimonas denitrificans TaxID=3056748 RepID=A0AAE5CAG5_9BACT|nr:hypothetical protein [Gemmatimonadota bacterium]NIR74582.1 hypothetical protein [Candidatus Kutchimonas denitrificans]NIS02772.1 hypothetical protein [Gemmatimonadota bacterium]NIT68933.1 hypothetical protein [Gemmatimonadota bacterium]NIU52238.1 hypothetical protein [Gemmatimonadota bacterium]
MRMIALTAVLSMLLPTGAAAQSHLIVVSGLGGQPGYSQTLHEWATGLSAAAQERWGVPEANVTYLAEKVERDPTRIDARSTWENVQAAVRETAARAGPDDVIFIVLMGHGTVGVAGAKLNLPGPDPTAADFDALLDELPTRKVALVNTASASGEFIPALASENRVVITATRSGRERNQTIFARYFVEAYAGDGADVDKDGRVSALEAFNYARREVERLYESENRLLTEHALLEDDGDGEGSREPGPDAGDGRLASRLFLAGAPAAAAAGADADPRLAELYNERRALEEAVADLRARKDEMDPAAYEAELERLLLELAMKTREIRQREEEGGG